MEKGRVGSRCRSDIPIQMIPPVTKSKKKKVYPSKSPPKVGDRKVSKTIKHSKSTEKGDNLRYQKYH
jgi:hypothetical protein